MKYSGQVNRAGNLSGFGRLVGTWGSYEGEYFNPSRSSYGRMVFDRYSFYEGKFVNFKLNG